MDLHLTIGINQENTQKKRHTTRVRIFPLKNIINMKNNMCLFGHFQVSFSWACSNGMGFMGHLVDTLLGLDSSQTANSPSTAPQPHSQTAQQPTAQQPNPTTQQPNNPITQQPNNPTRGTLKRRKSTCLRSRAWPQRKDGDRLRGSTPSLTPCVCPFWETILAVNGK